MNIKELASKRNKRRKENLPLKEKEVVGTCINQ